MRIRDITEGVGRITKQNQTVDVGPDEVKTQAAKFGFKVDKDGRPPTLSKRVKGSPTNVLFNLGLSESRIRQLEASYEGNIGIMELMKFFQTAPKELVAQVKELIKQKQDKEVWRIVQKYTGTKLKGKEFETYTRDQLPQIKNKELSKLKHTIETVALKDIIPVQEERIIENFKRQVDNIVAGKYNPIIVDCNNKIVNGHHRYTALEMLGYESAEVARLPWSLKTILENFADGKVKGKSRPGRVKKSGASCNGSVTALRKRAKNASGEKAKMYHWCANMKAGKNNDKNI